MFYQIEPEVPGGWEGSDLDTSTQPPTVTRLRINIEDWLEDCAVQTLHCVLALRPVAHEMEAQGFTGFVVREAEVVEGETFADLNDEGTPLPDLVWLDITGTVAEDDVSLHNGTDLVVSARTLDLFRRHQFTVGTAVEFPADSSTP